MLQFNLSIIQMTRGNAAVFSGSKGSGQLETNDAVDTFINDQIPYEQAGRVICGLNSIDFLLTNKSFFELNPKRKEGIRDRVETFLINSNAINPYSHLTYNLGDKKSKLEITVGYETKRGCVVLVDGNTVRTVKVVLKTDDKEIEERFKELTQKKLNWQFILQLWEISKKKKEKRMKRIEWLNCLRQRDLF